MDTLKEIKEKLHSNVLTYLGECKVWIINVNDFRCYFDQITKILSNEEIKKSEEIKGIQKRELFCLRKGITRILISEYLKVNYWEICYYYNDYKKPYVHCNSKKRVYFNISHSKEYFLIGISKSYDIGVDIEKVVLKSRHLPSEIFTYDELRLFNKYCGVLCKNGFFYKLWVQKEAICKALGVGITIELNQFSVSVNPYVNYEEYYINVDSFNCNIEIKVQANNEYAFAIALIK